MDDLVQGTRFAGRYRIDRLLGRGGMAVVYLAHDEVLDESVAVKVLVAPSERESERLDRFRREVRLARRVTHRNVARVFDLGEADGVHYLTMEWIDGDSLDRVLARDGRLPPADAVRIATDIADGLAAAHEAGIVHRDLKPGNVMLERSGRVAITDFGIARALAPDPAALTRGVIGTPAYMAPEQRWGAGIDARTDLYGLGMLLFELIAGRRPNATGTVSVEALDKGPDLGERSGVSPAVRALVQQLLAVDPADRPGSAAAVAAALRGTGDTPDAVAGDRDALAEAATKAEPARARSRRFAPLATDTHGLAVIPFRYRGDDATDYLGEAFAEELADVLARSRGLRVLSVGATRGFGETPDPRQVARELGVDAIVDGTVTRRGLDVRVTARVVDATGTQLWSERFDRRVEDVLDLGDLLAQRVAENLRIELTTAHRRGAAPAAAIDRYLAGRRKARRWQADGLTDLEAALALAPDFEPALALHALALVRAWFAPDLVGVRDWETLSRDAVDRALSLASDLPESHLAAAVRAGQLGEYRVAASSLARALELAPTFADAQEYLGLLQCEAGRGDEGVRRLRLAADLDPAAGLGLIAIARHHALHGRVAEYAAVMAEVQARGDNDDVRAIYMRVRIAAWTGDHATMEREVALATSRGVTGAPLLALYVALIGGTLGVDEIERRFAEMDLGRASPRLATLAEQLMTEAYGLCGDTARAARHLDQALMYALADLEWLDLCPALAGLRATDVFVDVRAAVRVRTEAIWSA